MTRQITPAPTDDALDLPGLDLAPVPQAGRLEQAVLKTLEELSAQGHIGARDAGKVALALELADVIAMKRRTGRASTIGHDARVLLDLLDGLVPEAGEVDDELKAAMAAWEEAQRANDAAP